MFKQNREFWLYFLGVILLFFFIFGILQNGFSSTSYTPSAFPFNLFQEEQSIIEKPVQELDMSVDYYAVLRTNKGNITIDLLEANAPNTVANFIHLANKNYYYNVQFHRFIPGYLLQGGSSTMKNDDPNDDALGGPGYTIPHEINWESLGYDSNFQSLLKVQGYSSVDNVQSRKMGKFSVCLAANGPDTGGGQFFIVLADNADPRLQNLEGRHTVFGHVIGGFDVINEINKTPTIIDAKGESRPSFLILYNVSIGYYD